MKRNIKSKNLIVKTSADVFMPLALMFGIYVILHGHLSPGGGFQGGVIVASAVILVYLGYGHLGLKKVFSSEFLKKSETIGAIMYSGFALIGILFGANFCRNIFVDKSAAGNPGELFSSGTIFWMNLSVGFKVLTGIGFLMLFMLGLVASIEEKE
jgi:multisubunit Na+/H+ antiporter MnhB subunit